jgi:hypothetical protein
MGRRGAREVGCALGRGVGRGKACALVGRGGRRWAVRGRWATGGGEACVAGPREGRAGRVRWGSRRARLWGRRES